MAVEVVMPKVGMGMVDGIVVKWLVQDGEFVTKDTPVVIVMSKKVSFEVNAPATGILRHVARVKETLPVGQVIGYVTEQNEALPGLAGVAAPAPAAAAAPSGAARQGDPSVLASPATRRLAKDLGVDLTQVAGTGPEGRITEQDVHRLAEEQATRAAAPAPSPTVLATSTARKLAEEQGVDLAQISGRGPGGRITEEDVARFVEVSRATIAAPPPAYQAIPFIGMRQMIAERLWQSLQSMAQLTMTAEADATEVVRLHEQLKESYKVTFTDIFVKAVAFALKQHPILNASLVDDEIRMWNDVHMGVAVALEDGLIVPVIRNADRLRLPEIAAERARLIRAAREGTISVDEVTGSTFTVTNVGAATGGGGFGTPIINPPEVAILGVGGIVQKPVVYRGEIAIRSVVSFSLSFDHRVVDGVPAGAFLATLTRLMETPYVFVV